MNGWSRSGKNETFATSILSRRFAVSEDNPAFLRIQEQGAAHGRSIADRMVLRALLIALDGQGEPDAFMARVRSIAHEQISGLNTANDDDGPLLRGIKIGAKEVADMLTMPVRSAKDD